MNRFSNPPRIRPADETNGAEVRGRVRASRDPGHARGREHGVPTSSTELPRTSQFLTLPNGIPVHRERMASYSRAIQTFAHTTGVPTHVMQDFGQKLLDMHFAAAGESADALQEARRSQWRKDFETEAGNRRDTVLNGAKSVIAQYGREMGDGRKKELLDVLSHTGAGDHRALIHFVSWAGRQGGGSSDVRPEAEAEAKPEGRADRMFRRSAGGISRMHRVVAAVVARVRAWWRPEPVRQLALVGDD